MPVLTKQWKDFKAKNHGNAGDYDKRAAEEKRVYRQKLENWLTKNHASQPLSLPWSEDALKEMTGGQQKKRKSTVVRRCSQSDNPRMRATEPLSTYTPL